MWTGVERRPAHVSGSTHRNQAAHAVGQLRLGHDRVASADRVGLVPESFIATDPRLRDSRPPQVVHEAPRHLRSRSIGLSWTRRMR